MLDLVDKLSIIETWNRQTIHDAIQNTAAAFNVKLPKVAMPLRVVVTGEAQTPSIDAILELLGKTETLRRMHQQIPSFSN
jgi:glutamyl-tRNA synthetase